MNLAAYQRQVIAYHGCDAKVAASVLAGRTALRPSEEEYDWLGRGIYFWEHGPDRALDWAKERKKRGKIETPAVVGAVIQLGSCFDLLDTRCTTILPAAFVKLRALLNESGKPMPDNAGGDDLLLRRRDCLVLNWLFDEFANDGEIYQTVRGVFQEGERVFEDSGIRLKSHIQIAVRDPSCIVGYFRPV